MYKNYIIHLARFQFDTWPGWDFERDLCIRAIQNVFFNKKHGGYFHIFFSPTPSKSSQLDGGNYREFWHCEVWRWDILNHPLKQKGPNNNNHLNLTKGIYFLPFRSDPGSPGKMPKRLILLMLMEIRSNRLTRQFFIIPLLMVPQTCLYTVTLLIYGIYIYHIEIRISYRGCILYMYRNIHILIYIYIIYVHIYCSFANTSEPPQSPPYRMTYHVMRQAGHLQLHGNGEKHLFGTCPEGGCGNPPYSLSGSN